MTDELKNPVTILKDKLTGRSLETFELTVQVIQDYGLKRHRDAAQEATQEAEEAIAELQAAIKSLSSLPQAAQDAAKAGIQTQIDQHEITVKNALRSVIEAELAEGPYKAWVDAAKSSGSGRGRSKASYWRDREKVVYFSQGKTDEQRKQWLQSQKLNPSTSLILAKSDFMTGEEWAKVDGATEYGNDNTVHVIGHDGHEYKYLGNLGPQNSANAAVLAMRDMLGLPGNVSVGIHGTGWDSKFDQAVDTEALKKALVK